MIAKILPIAAILVTVGCATPQSPDYKQFQKNTELSTPTPNDRVAVSISSPEKVDVRGIYNPDDSIGAHGMLYAGDAGAGGLLAQVLVHAAISSNAQDKKLAEQQKQANQVLAPIQDLIEGLNAQALVHDSSHYHFVSSDQGGATKVIRSQPIFFVSQDLTTFSVKHLVEMVEIGPPAKKQKRQKKPAPLYSNVIEVIGTPIDKKNAVETYRSGDGTYVKATLASLYKRSLELLMDDLQGKYSATTPQQSFKFSQGEHQRFERGNILLASCERTVLRNLRGWVIAFDNQDSQSCTSESPSALPSI